MQGEGGGVLLRGVVNLSFHRFSRWGQQRKPRVLQLGGSTTGGEPEFPSVVPMGTTMDTTGSTMGEGSTSELLSMSHDGLPLVPPTTRGRTCPTMGSGRTHILDGDWKDSYLECQFLSQVWADCNSKDFQSIWPKGVHISGIHIFQDAKLCVPDDRVRAI